MKRILFALILLVVSINAIANSKVTSGDKNILRDASGSFIVEFDFTNTKVENKPYKEYIASRSSEWNRDWQKDCKTGIGFFIKKWNRNNKKGMMATEDKTAAYRLVIKPSYINFGSAAMSWTIGFGAGGMKMSCTMELYRGDEKVLVIDVKDQTGKSAPSETKRFASLMEELADDTYKDILK